MFCTNCGQTMADTAVMCPQCGAPVPDEARRRIVPYGGGSKFQDFLQFRRMITPVIIQIVFWVGVAICVIGGIGVLASPSYSYYNGSNYDGTKTLTGLAMIFLGPIVVRVYCEILMVVFRMNATLTDISNEMKKK